MPTKIRNLKTVDDSSFPYVFEKNVDVPLKAGGLVRANVYRPKAPGRYPVLCTYGPYGKDVYYGDFHVKSFSEVNGEQKSTHSAWETPDPLFWTNHGYVVVRTDERGTGQSPGLLDTMSRGTSEAFFDVVEWASEQEWSSGKVGLLGISYYAGSQWRVAARRPKGLACIIPWEGMSDYYRDRVRHGGILSNNFIAFWWNRQVVSYQYGLEGRSKPREGLIGGKSGQWGEETLEGNLTAEELRANRQDQTIDTAKYKFRDEEYFASKEYRLEDIEVPVLSVANWGGILLHLRGNIQGYLNAGSKFKYLRAIVGRHDLPFYYKEEVEIQHSFLDAFLKGEDRVGWSVPGKVPAVDIVLRKGNPGFNNAEKERAFPRRTESEWPIARTKYTNYYLTSDGGLSDQKPSAEATISYEAPGGSPVTFTTSPFEQETEVTGHVVAHLNASCSAGGGNTPSDIDLFLTIRHYGADGKEIFYTGTAGDPVPVTKGWLRVSLRKVDSTDPVTHQPIRNYLSSDVQAVEVGKVYPVDVEIWPTNVVVEKGGKLGFEIAPADTQGSGIFLHNHPEDRPDGIFKGMNHIHFGPNSENYVTLPIIPNA